MSMDYNFTGELRAFTLEGKEIDEEFYDIEYTSTLDEYVDELNTKFGVGNWKGFHQQGSNECSCGYYAEETFNMTQVEANSIIKLS